MDNMVVNAVAPWKGYLHKFNNIREGNGKNGPWAFADLTVKYTDHKMQEKYMTFTVGSAELVEKLRDVAVGTPVQVAWYPDSTEDTQRDRWYPSNKAYNVTIIESVPQPEKPKAEKITAPNFPEQPNTAYAPVPSKLDSREAWKNPYPTPDFSADLPDDDSGLPF